jgi:hypothetical protein
VPPEPAGRATAPHGAGAAGEGAGGRVGTAAPHDGYGIGMATAVYGVVGSAGVVKRAFGR